MKIRRTTPGIGVLDQRYLKLDASNDPITGDLLIRPDPNSITALQVQQTDGTDVFVVDTTNVRVGINNDTPTERLHLKVGNVEGIRIESSNNAFIDIGSTTSTRWRWSANFTATNLFQLLAGNSGGTPSTNIIAIKNTGEMGINQTVPGAMLQIDTNGTTKIGQIIKAVTSQEANLQEYQDSSGNVLSYFGPNGELGVGVDAQANESFFRVNEVKTSNTSTQKGAQFLFGFVPTTDSVTTAIGTEVIASHTGAGNQTNMALAAQLITASQGGAGDIKELTGSRMQVNVQSGDVGGVTTAQAGFYELFHANSSTMTEGFGFRVTASTIGFQKSPTITDLYGAKTAVKSQIIISGASAVTNAYGYATDITSTITVGGTSVITNGYMFRGLKTTSTGTITNLYGLYLDDIDEGATINSAITTNAGNIIFNEGGDANTDLRVEGATIEDVLFVDASVDEVQSDGRGLLRYSILMGGF